jgi:hypothetical protein
MDPVSESRDWPEDFLRENGTYQCRCSQCGNIFNGHKRRVVCKLCADRVSALVSREEAAEALERPTVCARAYHSIVALHDALAAKDATIADLVKALEATRDQFLFYEKNHRKKAGILPVSLAESEALRKADVNRDMAAMIDAVLSRARGGE